MVKPLNPTSEIALKAREIVNNAFKTDKKNTRFVAPARIENIPRGYRVSTITKIPGQRSRLHRVTVFMERGYHGPFTRCPHVKVGCDCERYKFFWNYALLQRDAAVRDRTNGEPPVVTNPEEIPGICKHGIIALRLLIRDNPRWVPPATTKLFENDRPKTVKLAELRQTLRGIHGQKS